MYGNKIPKKLQDSGKNPKEKLVHQLEVVFVSFKYGLLCKLINVM